MDDPEDLDDLLDSALDDFQGVDRLSSTSSEKHAASFPTTSVTPAPALGQGLGFGLGLGSGLPELTSGKKKSGGKPGSTSKNKNGAGHVSTSRTGPTVESNLSTTLERLAEQTRQTVGNIDAGPEINNTAEEMENFVRQFEELGRGQDVQSLMDTMMRQLLSKDVLYEPMKEIGERYPEWLESHKSELSKEDLTRYMRQHEFIKQLCQVYETTPNDFQRVVDLMQNMQDCGQPPPDIVRELAPGLELGEDGLPVLPDFSGVGATDSPGNCTIM